MKPASIRALETALEREAFGQHLRRLRQQRALSQEAAAHEIGCSVKSLHDRVLRELARREGEREP